MSRAESLGTRRGFRMVQEVLPQDQAVKPLKRGQVDPQLGDEALARVAGAAASAWPGSVQGEH